MANFEEITVNGLRIQIDRSLCVGFGDCVDVAREAFDLDGEDIAVFKNPLGEEQEQLLDACQACPVDAITVWDSTGTQLAPDSNIEQTGKR